MSAGDHPGYQAGDRHVLTLSPGVEMAFRYIPPGEFRMGARGYRTEEQPVHRVKFARGFWLGETVVTQAQFEVWTRSDAVARKHMNSISERPNHPAESMTWWDAVEFGAWVRERCAAELPAGVELAGLPTEAEWEYACRAGSETEYYNGDGEAALAEVGWFDGNAGGRTHDVDEMKERHPWGLRGMHGNVWEWCHDVWGGRYEPRPINLQAVDGDGDPCAAERAAECAGEVKALRENRQPRVVRGGTWLLSAGVCRSAFRVGWHLGLRDPLRGFRLCLAPGPAAARTETYQPEAEPA